MPCHKYMMCSSIAPYVQLHPQQGRHACFKDIKSSTSTQDSSAITESIGMWTSSAMFSGDFVPIHLLTPDLQRKRKKKKTDSVAQIALEQLHVKGRSKQVRKMGAVVHMKTLELHTLQEEVRDSECSYIFNSFTHTTITQCMICTQHVTHWIWDSARDHSCTPANWI